MNKFFARLWTPAAALPLLTLAVVLAAQTLYALDARALWFSDEVRYANVLQNVIEAKNWLVMYLNGAPYSDKPPVYFWFLAALSPVFPTLGPPLFMLGSAISSFLFLAATSVFTRRVLGADRHTSLAAGLLLLTCFYFVGVSSYTRMDLLFGAIITLSHVFFFAAWNRDRAPKLMITAFALAGIAVLTKGPLGLAFPFITGVAYLAWTGRITRLFRRDVLIGFLIFAAIVGGWLGAAWISGEHEFVRRIFYKEVYRRAMNAPHHGQGLWYYFGTLPLAWLPWTFIILTLPLARLFRGGFWKSVWRSRSEAGRGAAYAWIMLISGFTLLTLVSIKIIIYLLPVFPALAALTARHVLALDEARTRRLFYAVGGVFLIAALVLPFGNMLHIWPIEIKGLFITAIVAALAGALIVFGASRGGPRGALIITALAVTAWLVPLNLITAPSLDQAMSPKAQAKVMGEYVRDGYKPMAYRIYSGTYTYYAGVNVAETQDREWLARQIAAEPKVVVGMQKRYWDDWENRPRDLKIVHEQWIVERPYVLAIKDSGTVSAAYAEPEPAQPAQVQAVPVAEPVNEPEPNVLALDGNKILRLEHETLGDAFSIRVFTSHEPVFAVRTLINPRALAVDILDAATPPVPSGARDLPAGSASGHAVTRLKHDTQDNVFSILAEYSGEVAYEVRPLTPGPGIAIEFFGVDMPGQPAGVFDMQAYGGN
jgi:4-amino-4-deoxy-L-arabinose transferase-like glycosyltransferase